MKKFFKEHYGYIVASVIAGLLIALILGMLKYFLKVSIFSSLFSLFCKKITIPLYIALLLILFGMFLTLIIKCLLKKRIHSKTDWYVRDEVNGLVWEWCNYVSPRSFDPLCPRCLAELPIRNDNQTKYLCVSCGFKKKIACQHNVMLKLVKIEVEKRERTEEWKDAKKRIKEIKLRFDAYQDADEIAP